MTYIVYCRFYSHKMKVEIEAESATAAKKVVQSNLEFIKIIKEEPFTADGMVRNLKDILGMQ